MKKFLSLFLALLLAVSIAGCAVPQASPVPTATDAVAVAQILVPGLVGKSIDQLEKTENYQIVEVVRLPSDQPAGTILSQEPIKGSFADIGCTISVTVSAGDGSEVTQPPQVQPERPAEPVSPQRPPQTDPEIPPQEEQPTQPPVTEAAATQPPQTEPSQTQPPATEAPATQPPQTEPPQTDPPAAPQLDPNGSYTSKSDVALYITLYGRLPNNFITKNQAEDRYGTTKLSKYGLCIGGDRFYNNEGRLPSGYTYYECDIDTLYSSKRGSKRLVFTYSGIVYYTSDHYKSFTRLY